MNAQDEYLKELQEANTDELAPGIGGNLVRIAQLAGSGLTSQSQREEIAVILLKKAKELNVDSKNLLLTALELILRS